MKNGKSVYCHRGRRGQRQRDGPVMNILTKMIENSDDTMEKAFKEIFDYWTELESHQEEQKSEL